MKYSVVIDDALRSLQIRGSLLLNERYAPPWAVAVPDAKALQALLQLDGATHVAAFHWVESGHCTIQPAGADAFSLGAGEVAILFSGAAHRIFVGKSSKAQSFTSLLSGVNARQPDVLYQPSGTSLICGAFFLRHSEFNPLLRALPPVLHARLARPGGQHNLPGVAQLLAQEISRSDASRPRSGVGGGYVAERLLEVLCAEAVRAHIEAEPDQKAGWIRGVKDPVAGQAIAAIHARPGAAWSVQLLAQQVPMSPSRFAARFTQAVGDTPMAYLAKWRMNAACRKLAASRASVEQIAAEVGYESPATFNRAFKKMMGLPPATWRKRQIN